MAKKGAALWISVVLYFGIGIVILTILLTAGLPVIDRLRDKNVIIQTKEVMHTIDENIREVIKEGSGSQRVLTINLKKGTIDIDTDEETVIWLYKGSKVLISEPEIPVPEGKITVLTTLGLQKKTYDIKIMLNYGEVNADIVSGSSSNLMGMTDLIIRNDGLGEDDRIKIRIFETN